MNKSKKKQVKYGLIKTYDIATNTWKIEKKKPIFDKDGILIGWRDI